MPVHVAVDDFVRALLAVSCSIDESIPSREVHMATAAEPPDFSFVAV
jgi:hypothetical protein